MQITLKPEDEQIVKKRLQSGVFANVDEVIHHALQALDAEEANMRQNLEGPRRMISPAARVRGLLKTEGTAPKAEEVNESYTDYLVEK